MGTQLTDVAEKTLKDTGADTGIELMKRFEGGAAFRLATLTDTIETRLKPETREAIVLAANADPEGVAKSIQAGILKNPDILKRMDANPEVVVELMPAGFKVAPGAPDAAASPQAPENAAQAVEAAQPAPANPAMDQALADLAGMKDFDKFMKRMGESPEFSKAFKDLMSADGADGGDAISTIAKQAKQDPEFFVKLNKTIEKRPQIMHNLAETVGQDPKGAFATLGLYMKADEFVGNLQSFMSGIFGEKAGQWIASLADKLVDKISPDMAADLGKFAAPLMENLGTLQKEVDKKVDKPALEQKQDTDPDSQMQVTSNNDAGYLRLFIPEGKFMGMNLNGQELELSAKGVKVIDTPKPQQPTPGLGMNGFDFALR